MTMQEKLLGGIFTLLLLMLLISGALFYQYTQDQKVLQQGVASIGIQVANLAQDQKIEEEVMMKDDNQEVDTKSMMVKTEDAAVKDVQNVDDAMMLDYTFKEYTVSLPSSWELKETEAVIGSRYSFIENGKEVGYVVCPIPETGFEAWDFTESNRVINVKWQDYGFSWWNGVPKPGTDVNQLHLMHMYRGNKFSDWYVGDNAQYSCMMSLGDIDKNLANDIFWSISVN